MKLKNKTAIITGGSARIGKAIATRFVQEGCKVAIADINQAAMEELSNALNQQYGDMTFPLMMNVADEKSVTDGFKIFIERYQKLDILILI